MDIANQLLEFLDRQNQCDLLGHIELWLIYYNQNQKYINIDLIFVLSAYFRDANFAEKSVFLLVCSFWEVAGW